MAKRITLKDVKHVDFEPAEFLLELASNPGWNVEDIGCYFVICLHLYVNGGKMQFEPEKLAKMCRTNLKDFDKSWEKVAHKFSKKQKVVSQKRVRKELKAARVRMQNAYTSGLKGAEKRWGSYSKPVAKRKRNEDENKDKDKNETKDEQPSSSLKNSPSFSLRFAEKLEKAITPRTESDKMALVNLIHWLRNQQSDNRTYDKVLKYAKEAKTGRNPIAVFFATLKRELGYRLNR